MCYPKDYDAATEAAVYNSGVLGKAKATDADDYLRSVTNTSQDRRGWLAVLPPEPTFEYISQRIPVIFHSMYWIERVPLIFWHDRYERVEGSIATEATCRDEALRSADETLPQAVMDHSRMDEKQAHLVKLPPQMEGESFEIHSASLRR